MADGPDTGATTGLLTPLPLPLPHCRVAVNFGASTDFPRPHFMMYFGAFFLGTVETAGLHTTQATYTRYFPPLTLFDDVKDYLNDQERNVRHENSCTCFI